MKTRIYATPAVNGLSIRSSNFFFLMFHAKLSERQVIYSYFYLLNIYSYLSFVLCLVLFQELAAEFERPLRVVGWYHSHPHITVWPSHVG